MNRLLVTIIVTTILGCGTIVGSASAQVDGTPPTITITSPTEGQHFALNSAISTGFSCDDPGGSGVASCAATGPPSTSSAGAHTYTVNATDVAGNAASKTVNYVVDADMTAPTITITSPVDGHHYPLGTTINGSYGCEDSGGSGIATCVTSTPIAGTVGMHTFTVTASDGAGNPATKSVTYHIDATPDTTAPVITITSPVDNQHYAFGATINATYSCDDPGTGIATCTSSTPINNAVGTHTFTVNATDNSGNPATKSVMYTVDPSPSDTTAPTITISSPVDGQHYALGSTINGTFVCNDPGSGIATCTATPIVNTVGMHTFTVSATDGAGNPATKSVTYTIDSDATAPTITITSPVDGQHYALGATINATYVCDDAGGSFLATCAPTTPIDLNVGSHVFTVHATDGAGNATTRSPTYIIDAPPGGGAGTPGGGTAGTQNGTPTVDGTGSTGLASTPRVTIPTRASRTALARGVSVSLSRLKARSRVVLQIRRGLRTIKTMRATANAAGTVRFRIRLSPAQLRTLRGKTLMLRFSTTAASGKKKVVTRKLKVV